MKLTQSQLRKLIREELLSERASGDKTLDAKIRKALKTLADCASAFDALDTYVADTYPGNSEYGKEVDTQRNAVYSVIDELNDVDESVFSNLRSTAKEI